MLYLDIAKPKSRASSCYNKLTRLEPAIQSKTSTWATVNFKKRVTLMSFKPEPVIWSCDTGQCIPILTGVN